MKIIIKQICRRLLVFAALIYISQACSAQTLVFYFVAPLNVISTNFPGAIDSQYCPSGYAKATITAANAGTFNTVAPPMIKHVFTQLQSGTILRTNVNQLFLNSNGTVRTIQYWLADDRTSFNVSGTGNMAGVFMAYPAVNPRYVWPAAFNYDPGGGNFIGIVGLGEHQLQTDQSRRVGGINAVNEVVLHESSHTQFMRGSKWEGVGGNAITYGADGQHYSRGELLADQEGALNEGLATFYGFVLNDSALQALTDYYNNTGYRYFVEGRSFLAGQHDLYTIADRVRSPLVHYHADGTQDIQHYAKGDEITIFSYRWRTVPGFFLLFNESVSTLFFSFVRNHTYANKDTAMSMIRYTAQGMSPERRKRFLSFACNRIALKMEEYNGSPTGRADTSRISSLFPFAVLDLLTHFGMSDSDYRADYRRNYADRDPRAFTEYFNRRNAIKALVQADINATPIRFREALRRLITYCKDPANIL